MKSRNPHSSSNFFTRITMLFVITFVIGALTGVMLPRLLNVFAASPPNIITYQGRVLNDNGVPVADASLDMEFRIYDSLAAGVCLWSNSSSDCDSDTPASTVSRTVSLTDGLFTQNLGDTGDSFAAIPDTVFDDNASLYLEIEIEGETLSPRKMITAAPFSLNADSLDGLDSTEFLASTGDTATGDYDVTGAFFLGATPIVFEGATDDGFQTTFAITDPTVSSKTITFKDESGTVAFLSDIGGAANLDDAYNNYGAVASIINVDAAEGQTGGLEFSIDGADDFTVDLQSTGDFVIQNAGTTAWTMRQNGRIFYDMPDITASAVTNGISYTQTALTATDSSTAASGTNPFAVFNRIEQSTVAATNAAVTTTDAATFYIEGAPLAGTNNTITNSYGLWVDDGGARIDGTVLATDFSCTDCLDYTEFADALTVDASTTTSLGANNLLFDLDGTGDLEITDNGSPFVSFLDDSTIDVVSSATTLNAFDFSSSTLTSGDAFTILATGAAFTGDVMDLRVSNAGASGNALNIQNNGTGQAIFIDQNGDTGFQAALNIDNTGNDAYGFEVDSSNGATQSTALVRFDVGNGAFDTNLFEIENAGTGNALDIGAGNGGNQIDVSNVGTGSSIFVDQNGDTASTFPTDAADAAVAITNTGNTGMGLSLYTNVDGTANAPLAYFLADNTAFDQDVLAIVNDGAQNSLRITQQGDTTSTVPAAISDSALHIQNSLNDGIGFSLFSSNGATANAPLSYLYSSGAAFDQTVMTLQQDGTGGALSIDQNNAAGVALAVDSTATTANIATVTGSALTSGTLLDLAVSSVATGNLINLTSTSATATAAAINIDLDNGDNDNDVFILTTDETTNSGTAADTVKARITASGEFLSDVGFTAGGASTNYRDGSITSTGAFTYASPTSFTWEDDASNTLMTLTDAGSVGNLNVTGTITGSLGCTDCLDFDSFADSMSLDAATTITGGAGETFGLLRTFTDGATEQGMVISVTPSDTGGSTTGQIGLVVQSAASTEGLDQILRLNNADTDDSVAVGLEIGSAAGTILTGIDLRDSDIVDAIALLDNPIVYDGIEVAEQSTGVLTWEDGSGNDLMTLTDGGTTGTLNVTGDITCTDCLDFTDFDDTLELDTTTTITGEAGETFAIFRTLTDATGESGIFMGVTASDTTSGTTGQYGLNVSNLGSTEGLDELLRLRNLDGDDSVGIGLSITSSTGTILTGIDVSDTTIVDALSLGGNPIVYDGVEQATLSSGVLTWEDSSGNDFMTLTDAGTTGNLDVTGTLSANDFSCTDCLDFDSFEDTLDIDAATDINLGTGGLDIVMDSTGDYRILDGAQSLFSAFDDGTIQFDTAQTSGTGAAFVYDTVTTGVGVAVQANGLTTGNALQVVASNAFSGNALGLFSSAAATGNFIGISSTNASGTAEAIRIDFDNGNNDNDVFRIISDETTNSGTAADTTKARITASGEFFSDVGFTAGGASTNYRDGSITSTGAFTYTSPTSFTWQDDGANTLMTLTDAGSTGNLNVTGTLSANDLSCTDCLDFDSFEDTLNLDATTDIVLGANDLDIDVNGAGGFDINLTSTGDFRILDGGTTLLTAFDTGLVSWSTAATTTSAMTHIYDTVTTGTAFSVQTNGLTTGNNSRFSASSAFSGNIVQLFTASAATGNMLEIASNHASATAAAINIDLDNGNNDNDVFILTTDETTNSGTAADTTKARITASGEFFSDVGFTAGGASTNFRDGSITSTGAFTYTSPTSFTWQDDGANTLMTLTDSGSTGDLNVTGTLSGTDITCTDCLGWGDWADGTSVLDATTSTQLGANSMNFLANGAGSVGVNLSSTGVFRLQDAGSTFMSFTNAREMDYVTDGTSGDVWDFTADSLTTGSVLDIDSGSSAMTSAYLVDLNHTATATSPLALSGGLLQLERNITADNTTVTNTTGDESLLTLVNNGSEINGGTYTYGAPIMFIDQNFTGYSGHTLSISDAASSNDARLNLSGGGDKYSILSGGGVSTLDHFAVLGSNLTTGKGMRIDLYSSLLSAADGIDVSEFASYSTNVTRSGNTLTLDRALTSTAGTLTVSGSMVDIVSGMTEAGGTINDSARLMFLDQNYASATGDVLEIQNAGTGYGLLLDQDGAEDGIFVDQDGAGSAIRIDQDADASTSIPFDTSGGALHVGNTGNDGLGLTVYSNNGATQAAELMYIYAANSAFDEDMVRLRNSGLGSVLALQQTADPAAAGTHIGMEFDYLINDDANADQTFAAMHLQIEQDSADIGDDTTALHIENVPQSGGAALDRMLFLENNVGTAVTRAIEIDGGSGAFTYDITLQNDETWSNGTDGRVRLLENGSGSAELAVFSPTRLAFDLDDTITFTQRLCHSGVDDASGTEDIGDCSADPGDLAEYYGSNGGLVAGDLVVADAGGHAYTTGEGIDTSKAYVDGTTSAYQKGVIGAISTRPNEVYAENIMDPSENPVMVALVGRIPVNVTDENGMIKAGDRIVASSTASHGMKGTHPGWTVGVALEDQDSPTDQIIVFVDPSWYAGDVIATNGTENVFADSFVFEETETATSGTPGYSSQALSFRGSGWDGAAAQDREMVMQADVSDSDDYRLSVRNDSGTEVAFINNEGDLAISGRFYPSDQGSLQTDKYIFYDSTGAPTLDYMRTNAAGWATGSYDFAEVFHSEDPVVAGEVVVFGEDDEHVRRSGGTPYDERIAGIVSTRPGFLAGEFVEQYDVPVALTGRVPTFVSGENGDIKPGDPLTTSTKAGYAMKATEPGPIVGYAMEPFSGNTGSIIAFVRASYYDGGPVSDAPAANNVVTGGSGSFATLDVSGSLNLNGGSILSIGSLTGIGNAWTIDGSGNVRTHGLFTHVIKSHQNEDVEVYATYSREKTIELSGTAEMKDGRAFVDFEEIDPKFNDVISTMVPYRVFLTPHDATKQLYAVERKTTGFQIVESGGTSDTKVDFMVIAYHKDYEPEVELDQPAEEPVEPADTSPAEEPVDVQDPAPAETEETATDTATESASDTATDTPTEPAPETGVEEPVPEPETTDTTDTATQSTDTSTDPGPDTTTTTEPSA